MCLNYLTYREWSAPAQLNQGFQVVHTDNKAIGKNVSIQSSVCPEFKLHGIQAALETCSKAMSAFIVYVIMINQNEALAQIRDGCGVGSKRQQLRSSALIVLTPEQTFLL